MHDELPRLLVAGGRRRHAGAEQPLHGRVVDRLVGVLADAAPAQDRVVHAHLGVVARSFAAEGIDPAAGLARRRRGPAPERERAGGPRRPPAPPRPRPPAAAAPARPRPARRPRAALLPAPPPGSALDYSLLTVTVRSGAGARRRRLPAARVGAREVGLSGLGHLERHDLGAALAGQLVGVRVGHVLALLDRERVARGERPLVPGRGVRLERQDHGVADLGVDRRPGLRGRRDPDRRRRARLGRLAAPAAGEQRGSQRGQRQHRRARREPSAPASLHVVLRLCAGPDPGPSPGL